MVFTLSTTLLITFWESQLPSHERPIETPICRGRVSIPNTPSPCTVIHPMTTSGLGRIFQLSPERAYMTIWLQAWTLIRPLDLAASRFLTHRNWEMVFIVSYKFWGNVMHRWIIHTMASDSLKNLLVPNEA